MNIKCRIIKKIYQKDDYSIFGAMPIGQYDDLMLNPQYHNFSIKGNGIKFLQEGEEYNLNLSEQKDKNGIYYTVESCDDLQNMDFSELTYEQSYAVMCNITSEQQAKYVLDAYPNFLQLVMEDRTDEIDVSKIFNVGDYRLNVYVREVKSTYKFYYIIQDNKEFDLSIEDCKKLECIYSTLEKIKSELNTNPYDTLVSICERGFERTDRLCMELFPELRESFQRVEHLLVYYLNLNELDGSSKINANELARYIKDDYPECIKLLKDVEVQSERIYYDNDSKNIAKMSTYLAECNIAEFVKNHARDTKIWSIDYTKYTQINEGTLTDEQSNILKSVCDNGITIVNAKGGTGKAQPIDTVIPTPNGNKKLGNIKIGDYVYDRLGKPTKVLGVYPQGLKDCYTVKLSDGRSTQCNDQHLWSYYPNSKNRKLATKTLREMIDNGIKAKNYYKYKIPLCEKIEFDEKKYNIDPYIIGAFLGNGCCTCKELTLSSNDEENVRLVSSLLNAKYKKNSTKNFNWSFYSLNDNHLLHTKEVFKDFQNEICVLSGEKHIPDVYKYGSISQRFRLLQGLFDTDGCITVAKNRFNITYSSTSEKLINDIANIIYSLGYSCSTRCNIRQDKNNCYELYVGIPNEEKYKFFNLSRKKDIAIKAKNFPKNRNYSQISIVDIKKETYQKEMVCIYVDNEEHLYLTNDYIVTHNTASLKAVIQMLKSNNLSFTLLAPTGKVSQRIKELTGEYAKTIHRAVYNGEISTDLVVVEEFGMVGIELMNMLVNSIDNPHTKLLCLGDLGQIAPISTGCVMRDIIESEVNYVSICTLSTVFRFKEGGLSKISILAYDGIDYLKDMDLSKKRITVGVKQDYTFVQSDNTLEQIVNEYKILLNKNYTPDDITIVTPWNVSPIGSVCINNAIQEVVNPISLDEPTIEYNFTANRFKKRIVFNKGAIVLNLKNNYNMLTKENWQRLQENELLCEDDVNGVAIFNGETGTITDIIDDYICVKFDDREVVFTRKNIYNLVLGYSVNSYKIQGSENSAIIVITNSMHKDNLNKNMMYTNLTRARKELVEIGDRETILERIGIDGIEFRNTFLKELLCKEIK